MFPIEQCENAIKWGYFNFVFRRGKLVQKSRIGDIWRETHSCVFKVRIYSVMKIFWTVGYKKENLLRSALGKNIDSSSVTLDDKTGKLL